MQTAVQVDLHDSVPLAGGSAAESHLNVGLVLGIWVVLGPLGQLLCDDVLVHGDQPCLHLLLNLDQPRTLRPHLVHSWLCFLAVTS